MSTLSKLLLAEWGQIRQLTYDYLDQLESWHLELTLPFPEAKPLGYQFWCMVGAHESYLRKLEQGSWQGFSSSLDQLEQVTPPVIQQQMMAADAAMQTLLGRIDLEQPLDNGQLGASVVLQLIRHELHHHGQLINYLFCHHLPVPGSWRKEWALGYDDAPYRPGRRGQVHTAYTAEYAAPLVMAQGDVLGVEERATSWNGWLWCTHPAGRSGWTPTNFLQRSGDSGIATRAYDASELTVAVGEFLTILETESGWAWSINRQGGGAGFRWIMSRWVERRTLAV